MLLALALGAAPGLHSQTGYTFTTLAGLPGRFGNNNGNGNTGGLPLFNGPVGLAVNKSTGNIYVADPGNALIRVIAPSGMVTTLAGKVGQSDTVDGTGSAAGFFVPEGPAVDSAGNIYVADYGASTIRKVTPAGVVTTLAGLALNPGSADGTGTVARFSNPSSIAIDSADNIYVADSGNHTIRKVTTAGVVTTLAGLAGVVGSGDGTTTNARFKIPRGVAVDSAGNIFVADTVNNLIRKVTPAGVVTRVAGTEGTFGSDDGDALTVARFSAPQSLAVDSAGVIYVADNLNNTIRRIGTDGMVTTLAGMAGASTASGPSSRVDGTGSAARFFHPTGVALDAAGNILVADYGNELIRKVTPAGVVTTLAGAGGIEGAVNGIGASANPALFVDPAGTATDAAGNVYVADTGNSLIRKITPAGVVTTLAGNPLATGRTDGVGAAATFSEPVGVAADAAGNVYVADTNSQLIRRVAPDGTVTTLAGTGNATGSADGTGAAASFNFPSGVAVDGAGSVVYVADSGNNTIRMVSVATGAVTTLAGTVGVAGHADGVGPTATFNHPRSVAVDAGGNVYVADTGNHTIRKIAPGGLVVTLAGTAGTAGSTDAIAGAARFNGPAGVAVDGGGTVYVTDTNNSTVRAISPAGAVTTLGGVVGSEGSVDGTGTGAYFNFPTGIAVDAGGYLYIADNRNNIIKKGFPPGSAGNPTNPGGPGLPTTPSNPNNPGSPGDPGGPFNPGSPTTGTGFFLHPSGIIADPSLGILYVADTAHNSIKWIAQDGTVSVLAGKDGTAGSTDGTGSAALFNGPTGLASDGAGNLFVCDTGNGTIRKVTSTGVVTTVAGSAASRGSADGTGAAAQFQTPAGILLDGNGNLLVSDSVNCTIRQVVISTGVVTTIAGTARSVGDADGIGSAARFNNPVGIALDTVKNMYIADSYNNTIRRITSKVDTAAASTGTSNAGGAYIYGTNSGFSITVPASTTPMIVTFYVGGFNAAGQLTAHLSDSSAPDYVHADTYTAGTVDRNFTIAFAAATSGQNLTLTWINTDSTGGYVSISAAALAAGSGAAPSLGGSVTTVSTAVNLTSVGTVDWMHWQNASPLIFDNKITGSNQIKSFSTVGTGGVTALTSDPRLMSWTDGASYGSYIVGNVVSTVAGSSGISGAYDGSGTFALFNLPQGLTVDSANNIIVADTGNNCIRRMDARFSVVTVAGIAGIAGSRDGPNLSALFNQPTSVYQSANLYVTDTGNSVLRTVGNATATMILKAPTSTTPATPATPAPTTTSTGGGSMDPWLAGALLTLCGFAGRPRRTARRL